jgi:hypothetical protein
MESLNVNIKVNNYNKVIFEMNKVNIIDLDKIDLEMYIKEEIEFKLFLIGLGIIN